MVHKDAPRRMKKPEKGRTPPIQPLTGSATGASIGVKPPLCVAPALCSVGVAQARERRRAYAGQ